MIIIIMFGIMITLGVASIAGLEFGVTTAAISSPNVTDLQPDEMGGWFDQIVGIVTYGFNALGSFFQLVTFQADIPIIFSFFLTALVGLLILILYKLIRKG